MWCNKLDHEDRCRTRAEQNFIAQNVF